MDGSEKPAAKSGRHWRTKFACAFRGLSIGVRGQSSYAVHVPVTLAVFALAAWLRLSVTQWSILLLCVAIVVSAELFNSALEHLAKAITSEQNEHVRNALDVASGAVLVASIGAAIVGLLVLGWPLLELVW